MRRVFSKTNIDVRDFKINKFKKNTTPLPHGNTQYNFYFYIDVHRHIMHMNRFTLYSFG